MRTPLLFFCGAVLLAAVSAGAESGAPPPASQQTALSEAVQGPARERPNMLWWPTPDEYLEAIFGRCGVRRCCKRCVGGKACGNTCIRKDFTCHVGCGCACDRPTHFVLLPEPGEHAATLVLAPVGPEREEPRDDPP